MNLAIYNLYSALLSIESSTIFTGTQKLLNDLSKALLIIAPIAAIICFIYMGIRKMNADEHEAPMWKKRMVSVGVGLVIALCASGIVAIVTSYYGS